MGNLRSLRSKEASQSFGFVLLLNVGIFNCEKENSGGPKLSVKLTLGRTRVGEVVPPPLWFCFVFFVGDKAWPRYVLSSCSIVPSAQFETRLTMGSYYGYEVLHHT